MPEAVVDMQVNVDYLVFSRVGIQEKQTYTVYVFDDDWELAKDAYIETNGYEDSMFEVYIEKTKTLEEPLFKLAAAFVPYCCFTELTAHQVVVSPIPLWKDPEMPAAVKKMIEDGPFSSIALFDLGLKGEIPASDKRDLVERIMRAVEGCGVPFYRCAAFTAGGEFTPRDYPRIYKQNVADAVMKRNTVNRPYPLMNWWHDFNGISYQPFYDVGESSPYGYLHNPSTALKEGERFDENHALYWKLVKKCLDKDGYGVWRWVRQSLDNDSLDLSVRRYTLLCGKAFLRCGDRSANDTEKAYLTALYGLTCGLGLTCGEDVEITTTHLRKPLDQRNSHEIDAESFDGVIELADSKKRFVNLADGWRTWLELVRVAAKVPVDRRSRLTRLHLQMPDGNSGELRVSHYFDRPLGAAMFDPCAFAGTTRSAFQLLANGIVPKVECHDSNTRIDFLFPWREAKPRNAI